MQTTKTQNMAGIKVQTLKVWKCPIFPDLARFSGEPGFREAGTRFVCVFLCSSSVEASSYVFHNKNFIDLLKHSNLSARVLKPWGTKRGWTSILDSQSLFSGIAVPTAKEQRRGELLIFVTSQCPVLDSGLTTVKQTFASSSLEPE
jgi:hypothetical protein